MADTTNDAVKPASIPEQMADLTERMAAVERQVFGPDHQIELAAIKAKKDQE